MFPGMYPGMPPPPGMPGYAPFPPMWGWPGMPPPENNVGMGRSYSQIRRRPRRGGSGSRSRSSRRSSRSRSHGGGSSDSVLIRRAVMGRVIGKGGCIINSIRHDSGARIDAEDRDEDHCEFLIRGTPDQVQRAKAMIVDIADKALNPGSTPAITNDNAVGRNTGDIEDPDEIMDFPAELIGGIIGARGAKINEVRQNSGAKVQVDKSDDRCKVLIAGSPEQVQKARDLIRSLADEAEAAGESPEDGEGSTERLEFPLAAAGRIIGSRGAQIQEVRSRTGAQVKVEKLEDCCLVHLSGTDHQVDRAKSMVKALAEANEIPGTRRAECEETIEISQTQVGRLIGKGGETIQRLQRDSGAKIDVNNALDPSPVRLGGSREAVHRAKWMIHEVLAPGSQHMWNHGQAAGYPDPWASWWGHAAGGYPPPGSNPWDMPAGDGGGHSKDGDIDLDDL